MKKLTETINLIEQHYCDICNIKTDYVKYCSICKKEICHDCIDWLTSQSLDDLYDDMYTDYHNYVCTKCGQYSQWLKRLQKLKQEYETEFDNLMDAWKEQALN